MRCCCVSRIGEGLACQVVCLEPASYNIVARHGAWTGSGCSADLVAAVGFALPGMLCASPVICNLCQSLCVLAPTEGLSDWPTSIETEVILLL